MSFGASIAVLVLVIAVVAAVGLYISRRPKSRRRKIAPALDPLSDPPTITHYGHG